MGSSLGRHCTPVGYADVARWGWTSDYPSQDPDGGSTPKNKIPKLSPIALRLDMKDGCSCAVLSCRFCEVHPRYWDVNAIFCVVWSLHWLVSARPIEGFEPNCNDCLSGWGRRVEWNQENQYSTEDEYVVAVHQHAPNSKNRVYCRKAALLHFLELKYGMNWVRESMDFAVQSLQGRKS